MKKMDGFLSTPTFQPSNNSLLLHDLNDLLTFPQIAILKTVIHDFF